MAFDPDRLRRWQVAEATTQISRNAAALYALSIGLGSDPLDPAALRYTDASRPDFAAFPSMVLVLGYTGFWLSDPALEVDTAKVLHIAQSIELLAPIPLDGSAIGRTTILELVDRGAGRGSLLTSRRDIHDAANMVFARVEQTHLLRGNDDFDPAPTTTPNWPQAKVVGEPIAVVEHALRSDQALLYRLNGDMNPLHTDPQIAAAAGFERPILHGMCTFGVAAQALARQLAGSDPALPFVMSARFTAPVYPGETLRTHIHVDGSFRTEIVERGLIALDAGRVQTGPRTAPHQEHTLG